MLCWLNYENHQCVEKIPTSHSIWCQLGVQRTVLFAAPFHLINCAEHIMLEVLQIFCLNQQTYLIMCSVHMLCPTSHTCPSSHLPLADSAATSLCSIHDPPCVSSPIAAGTSGAGFQIFSCNDKHKFCVPFIIQMAFS